MPPPPAGKAVAGGAEAAVANGNGAAAEGGEGAADGSSGVEQPYQGKVSATSPSFLFISLTVWAR